jgi:hypothetical protein
MTEMYDHTERTYEGKTSRGRTFRGVISGEGRDRKAQIAVGGIDRSIVAEWPLARDPGEREWQSWADSIEARHERETTQAPLRGERKRRRRG